MGDRKAPRAVKDKWLHPQPAKGLGDDVTAWWYGERSYITVVIEQRTAERVTTLQARISRKRIADYLREVRDA